MLKKWDATRSIKRQGVYHKLSVERKQDLLSIIALETFESGNYFFKERQAEGYITNYIKNIPDAQTDPKALLLDSKAILKSIEAQHGLLVERARGIYSFSHLTFHEFFTAKNIASSRNPQQAFKQLVSHITDKPWREIFLLTVGLSEKADDLLQLMKQKIDKLLAGDEKLQQFLTLINEKSCSVESPYKPVTVRALYLDLSLYLDLDLGLDLDRYFSLTTDVDRYFSLSLSLKFDHYFSVDLCLSSSLSLSLDLDRYLSLCLSSSLSLSLDLDHYLSVDCFLCASLHLHLLRSLYLSLDLSLDLELRRSLQELKDQLPDPSPGNDDEVKSFQNWWQKNGQAWTKKLRAVMIKHRNIGHDWQFNDDQKQLLKQYHDANKLLVDCLNSKFYVSGSVLQEIENTLLLPVNQN